MLENTVEELISGAQPVPNGFVVAMGIGTVFVGLIAIVIICKIMSLILAPKAAKVEKTQEVKAAPATENNAVIENRQEIIAAVAAVIAEELGTEVEALKIHSFKRI